MSSLLQVFFLIFIIKFQGSLSDWNRNSCRNPKRVTGTCVNIYQCPTLLKIHQSRNRSPSNIELLEGSKCGFEGRDPKVYCTQQSSEQSSQIEIRSGFHLRDDNNNRNNRNNYNSNKNVISRTNLLPQECGHDLSLRIVGGERTNIDEFPWTVLLEYQSPKGIGTGCGGVLISKRYVLTAAHCVKGKDLPKSWRVTSVRLGEYNTETEIDCVPDNEISKRCAPPAVSVRIEETISHENYNPYSKNQLNDITLLRLSKDVVFSDYIQPICLPTTDQLPARLWVAGWGKTESKRSSSIKLKVEVPVVDGSTCQERYREIGVKLESTQICAGGEKGKDSCRGDSGGPLMNLERAGPTVKWTVVGIVSFGPLSCGKDGWPGIYTKVTSFYDWIFKNMRS